MSSLKTGRALACESAVQLDLPEPLIARTVSSSCNKLVKSLQVALAVGLSAAIGGCVAVTNRDLNSKVTKQGQVVTFQLFVSRCTNLSSRTQVYLITDGIICASRLKAFKKTTEGAVTIYSGSLHSYAGDKRYFAVYPPKEPAQVFILTTQITPDGLDWIPCPRPDFMDSSDEPSWSLSNDINVGQRSTDLPSVVFKLRYSVTRSDFM